MPKNVETNDTRKSFDEAYATLNTAQKQAVDTIEGPVMVVAGPGTGKTQILTLRIANILLKTDTAPESVLALTFTESGARAMRERLHRYIGSDAYRVPIYTFHGFAGQLIAKYPDMYTHVVGGRPASEIEKVAIFESILDNPELRAVRPAKAPYHNLPKIKNIISKLKQEYVTTDKLSEMIAKETSSLAEIEQFHTKGAHKGKERGEYKEAVKNLEKNTELHSIYVQYEAMLADKKLFDFDDMLLETVKALKTNEGMLRDLQETYQYVLADEHQDVNGVQNTLLDTLVSYHDSPNIFAVGDEKQAIYRFQGASLENFLFFEHRYKGCVTISLTENYRSKQEVLDFAHSLIAVEEGPLASLRIPLNAATSGRASLSLRTFSHQALEDAWLIEQVEAEIGRGVPEREIAVLVRNNSSVEYIARILREKGLSVSASAEGDILTHPITNAVRDVVRVLAHPNNDRAWFNVLHATHHGVTLGDLAKINGAVAHTRPLASVVADQDLQKAIGLSEDAIVTLEKLVSIFESARSKATTEPLQRVLSYTLEASGFLDHVIKTSPHEGVRVLRRLYDEVESMVLRDEVCSFQDLEKMFETYAEYGIALSAPFINVHDNAISVMTAHKSKGLEFTSVFLPRLSDTAWGGGRQSSYFKLALSSYLEDTNEAKIDDERRLLYVAITRAKENIFLSHSAVQNDGKELLPTRLLDEVAIDLVETVSTEQSAETFDPSETLRVSVDTASLPTTQLAELFVQKGFSATSLNNYIQSPYEYLYQNLLMIPRVQNFSLQYGTAVHNVLERSAALWYATQKTPSVTELGAWLDIELSKLPLSIQEYTTMHERALSALSAYIEAVVGTWTKDGRVEIKIETGLETGIEACPMVRLTGKIDRIDIDDNGKAVRVVDYKTGTPKSRNAIEGNTKGSDGNYKRQLVFYALLLDLYGDERYQTREMTLSFVEQNTSGKIKEETFVITDEEVDALKATIIEAARNLISGDVWKVPCDPASCDYCDLLPV